jgi:hypothetical protein
MVATRGNHILPFMKPYSSVRLEAFIFRKLAILKNSNSNTKNPNNTKNTVYLSIIGANTLPARSLKSL